MNRLTPSIKNRERFAILLSEKIRDTLRDLGKQGLSNEALLDENNPRLKNIARGALNTVVETERLEEECNTRITENVLVPTLFSDGVLVAPYIVAVNCAATRLRPRVSVAISTLAEEFDLEESYLTNVLGMCKFRAPDGTTVPLFCLIRLADVPIPKQFRISTEAYELIHRKDTDGFPQHAFNG